MNWRKVISLTPEQIALSFTICDEKRRKQKYTSVYQKKVNWHESMCFFCSPYKVKDMLCTVCVILKYIYIYKKNKITPT